MSLMSDLSSSSHSDLRTVQVGRMMSWLLALEWVGRIVTAMVLSPRTWSGAQSHLHPHLWAAIPAGPAFILPAILLGVKYPTRQITRHVIAAAQMLVSALLVDLQETRRDLHLALPRGEFKLYFQPLVYRDGGVAGFEALLRWTHPVHGPVGPADFIPMAEKAGLIINIGEWVPTEACRECRRWQRPGCPPMHVGVNVSAAQFELPGLPQTVIETLRQCDLDPALLTLELTEGILVKDLSLTARQLEGLRALGIRISLDDFGTGYSSLSYLASMPVDTVKLDRSFLSRDSGSHSVIVHSVIALAHRIGMGVVAEGVETFDQSESLKALNCDELQGFYFSRPIPADAVAGFLDFHADPAAVAQLVA
jgi:EAL domain-containing protein (putative c-di-GMP-specific phosphodiesterase class I)